MLNLFNYIEFTPYLTNEGVFSKNLKNNIPSFDDWEKFPFNGSNNRLKNTNLWVEKKEMNSLNFRSDEFIKNHDGLHIVFAGCSNTWGSGLKQNEGWAYKTYKKILQNNQCSGYFNLAVLGSNVQSQIINLFKYFKDYGNPDIIFINFPDLLRFYYYRKKEKKYYDAFYKEDSEGLLKMLSFQYYLMLDQYCKSNNIKLYSFTWIAAKQLTPYGHKIIEVPFNDFDTYYSIDSKDINEYVKKEKNTHADKLFLDFARDEQHPGIAFHDYWSNFIYEKYKNNL